MLAFRLETCKAGLKPSVHRLEPPSVGAEHEERNTHDPQGRAYKQNLDAKGHNTPPFCFRSSAAVTLGM